MTVNLDRPQLDEHGELRLKDALGAQTIGATLYAEVELCVYPDSGKVGAWGAGVHLMNRPEANLPYGDGA